VIRFKPIQFDSKRGTRYVSAALAALVTFAFVASNASAQGARLQHIPPGNAVAGVSLPVEVTIEGSVALPTDARVYYRRSGDDAFQFSDLRINRYSLAGEVPAAAIISGDLIYYVWVETDGGATLTLPAGAPASGEYFRLPIRSLEKSASGGGSVVVLSPYPGSRLPEEQAVIAVSIIAGKDKIDPTSIRIYFDGKDFTSSAKITEDLLVLPLPTVRPGAHSVLVVQNKNGQETTLCSWSFEGAVNKQIRPEAGPIQANVTAGFSHDNISSQSRDVSFIDGRINGSYGKLNWGGRVYLNSLESKRLQPQNRYIGSLEYGSTVLRVGDTQPRFSEFTLWGTRSRGVEFAYHGSAFNLDVAQGELVRPVEGRLDSMVVRNAVGDTVKSVVDPSRDSTKAVIAAGRYKRSILDVRPGFPLTDNVTLSFNFLKAKDDTATIDWGSGPKDNVVLGADLDIKSKSRRFAFSTETAVSMFNSNTNDSVMSDAKDVEKFIVVNQNFEPLPTDTSILAGDLDKTVLAKKLLSELVKSSLAHRSTLTLNYFRNELKLSYKTIGRSFKSLGSPTIQTDVAGFSVEDRIRLLNSRLYLTVGYESYEDNINGRSPTTTERNIVRAGVSVYSPPSWPNLNLSYRIYDRNNDGTTGYVHFPSGDSLLNNTKVDNTQSQMGFSADQSFRLLGFDNLAGISYSNSATDDKINPIAALSLSTMGLNLQSKRQPWEWRAAISTTGQSSQNGASKVDYTSFSGGARYTLIPNHLFFNAGLGETMADGEVNGMSIYDPAHTDMPRRQIVSFSRLDLNGSAEYQITAMHLLTLSFSKAVQGDDSYLEKWNGAKDFNKDSPNFKKQDDTSIRLVYSFKM